MHANFEVRIDRKKRTVYCRMSGIFEESDMRAWASEYRAATDSFRSRPHLVFADMRGMKSTHPDVAALLGEEIAHARAHGVMRCVHLSDDIVQRMQAARVARQAARDGDVTVVVSSLEEAEQVLEDSRGELLDELPVSKVLAAVRDSADR